MYSLEDIFNLFINNEKKLLRMHSTQGRNLSCVEKYRHSVPLNYLYAFPNNVILKVTENCNLRCKHCFYEGNPNFYNKTGELTTEELKKLIDFLVNEINILSITLTGGEVFTQKDFLDILIHIKKKNLITTIQTNGILIDSEIAKKLGKILNPKTDAIQVSLEGADESSNDAIRGNGIFKKATQAMNLLRKNNINVQINTTLTTISAPNMNKMFELCNILDVNKLSISKYEVCNENQKYLSLSPTELLEYSYYILNTAQKFYNVKLKYKALTIFDFLKISEGKSLLESYIENNQLKVSEKKCLSCNFHDKITISSGGNIFFCSRDDSDVAILGNIREKNFYDIWENRFNTPYFQKRDMTTTRCKKCKFIPLCNTGCMVSAYKTYGDINCAPAECPYFEEYLRSIDE